MAHAVGGPAHAVGTALVGLGLLAAGALLQGWLPGDDADPGADPHVRTGGVGDDIDLRTADVRVEEVLGTTVLEQYGEQAVTPGVWVVVRYTVEAERENTSITFVELEDDRGRTWGLVGRNANSCVASPPGLPAHCTTYLEVPPDALPGLRLRLARLSSDTRFDAVAEVDLGLGPEDAAAFADAPPFVVPDPVLGDAAAAVPDEDLP